MNVQKACAILHIDVTTSKDSVKLKRQYHKQALLHHPDKNSADTNAAAARFKEINEAYNFLTDYWSMASKDNVSKEYIVLLEQFIIAHYGENSIINKIVKEVVFIYEEYTKSDTPNLLNTIAERIRTLDDDVLNYVFDFICRYRHLLRIASEAIDMLEQLINTRASIEVPIIYRLRPTLAEILGCRLYKLTIKEAVYYVPLWERINYFDIEGEERTLTVLCDPLLDDNVVQIDDGVLYIKETVSYEALRQIVGAGVLITSQGCIKVPLNELRITSEEQIVCIKDSGIPYGAVDDIQRGDVVVYVQFI